MKRRSVFADKLRAFPFVFGDDAVTQQRGAWRDYFQGRFASAGRNSPPTAEVTEGEQARQRDIAGISSLTSSSSSPRSLILEIGCYTAEFLSRIAAKHPHLGFIGLDWKARPLYLGAEQIAPTNLANLALLRGRAQDMTAIFANGELDEIWLLHPEPCDREKERPNRLMCDPFLIDAHRLLRPGGRLILKTDHPEYFQWTIELLSASHNTKRFAIEFQSSDFWNDPAVQQATADSCMAGEWTFYESRFVRRKQPIHFLQFRRLL